MSTLDRLTKANYHLRIALSEFNKIAGGTYLGSLRDLRNLIRVKMKVENLLQKMSYGEKRERARNKINSGK